MRAGLPEIVRAVLADDAPAPRLAPAWLLLPALCAVLYIGALYYLQGVQCVPVPTRPLSGDVVDSHTALALSWNALRDRGTEYRLQVSDGERTFEGRVFDTRVTDMAELKLPNLLEPGHTYYWRMCTIRNGHASPWTRSIRFRSM